VNAVLIYHIALSAIVFLAMVASDNGEEWLVRLGMAVFIALVWPLLALVLLAVIVIEAFKDWRRRS
jgi:hypothetical protein